MAISALTSKPKVSDDRNVVAILNLHPTERTLGSSGKAFVIRDSCN